MGGLNFALLTLKDELYEICNKTFIMCVLYLFSWVLFLIPENVLFLIHKKSCFLFLKKFCPKKPPPPLDEILWQPKILNIRLIRLWWQPLNHIHFFCQFSIRHITWIKTFLLFFLVRCICQSLKLNNTNFIYKYI